MESFSFRQLLRAAGEAGVVGVSRPYVFFSAEERIIIHRSSDLGVTSTAPNDEWDFAFSDSPSEVEGEGKSNCFCDGASIEKTLVNEFLAKGMSVAS